MTRPPITRGSVDHLLLSVCCAVSLLAPEVAARARHAAERHGATGPTDSEAFAALRNLHNARLLKFGNALTEDGENLLDELGPWRPHA